MIQARNQRNEKVVIQVKEKFGKIVAKTIEISAVFVNPKVYHALI